jgi:hypothetical protein
VERSGRCLVRQLDNRVGDPAPDRRAFMAPVVSSSSWGGPACLGRSGGFDRGQSSQFPTGRNKLHL